jgi:hypothetical protein
LGQGIEAWQVDYNKWEKHFYETNILTGRQKYYIADISL